MFYTIQQDHKGVISAKEAPVNKPPRPSEFDLKSLLQYIASPKEHSMVFYTLSLYLSEIGKEMEPIARAKNRKIYEEEIAFLESCAFRFSNSKLFMSAARLADTFAGCFGRVSLGEDKLPALQRHLRLVKEAIKHDPNNLEYPLALAKSLIELPQIRNFDEAKTRLIGLQSKSNLPPDMRGTVAVLLRKIEQMSGSATIDEEFDYCGNYLLTQERLVARQQILALKKSKNLLGVERMLNHLYRLAVLDGCESYIGLNVYCDNRSKALLAVRKLANRVRLISYKTHGDIEASIPFLGANDIKNYQRVWGVSENSIDPVRHFKMTPTAPYAK